MTKEKFYFLSDEYCEEFKNHGMIPISFQVDKYKEILKQKLKKYKVYDGLEFGYVQGREAAFLLQNICPVKIEHVVEEYINENTGKSVSVPNDLKRKLNAKARKIMNKYYDGTKIVITDLDYIERAGARPH